MVVKILILLPVHLFAFSHKQESYTILPSLSKVLDFAVFSHEVVIMMQYDGKYLVMNL